MHSCGRCPACTPASQASGGSTIAFVGAGMSEREAVLRRFEPDLELLVVPGAGHWVVYEAAEIVTERLGALLAR